MLLVGEERVGVSKGEPKPFQLFYGGKRNLFQFTPFAEPAARKNLLLDEVRNLVAGLPNLVTRSRRPSIAM